MVVPPIMWAKIAAGAAIVAMLVLANHLYSSHHYKRGVAACEADQAKANEQTIPITDTIEETKDQADEIHDEKTEAIRTEVRTGISALDLARAQREAKQNGEELGRAKAIAEYRAQGGCMSLDLPDDDGLLTLSRDQQRAIFGDVIGSDEGSKAKTLRKTPDR